MKNYFRQEQAEQTVAEGLVSHAGLASQVASVVVMLGLCYAAMPAFAGAGDSLLSGACSFMQDETSAQPAAPISVAVKPVIAITGTGQSITAFNAAPSQARNPGLPMVSPSMPDRHWCIAEAFNATLDHKNKELPLRPAAVNVKRPAYTGYCQAPMSETSLKTAAVPSRSLRQCQAVRT